MDTGQCISDGTSMIVGNPDFTICTVEERVVNGWSLVLVAPILVACCHYETKSRDNVRQ